MTVEDLQLLLANADDGLPTLQAALPLESAGDEPNPDRNKSPEPFADFTADPNDLALQRWGLIAPDSLEGDHLLDLVAPLRELREAAQGAPARVYRVPAGMDTAAAVRWRQVVYWDESVPEEDLPRYLLILGDIDRVSLELQQVLSAGLLVGRLVCPNDAGYAAYVEKVLRWERSPAEAAARALIFTAKDGTAATSIGYQALVTPSLERCRERKQNGTFHARDIHEIPYDGPNEAKRAFLEQLAQPDPAMLFTMSHGLGAPRGGWKPGPDQRAIQGAMSLGGGVRLTAEEIANVPFLPGGIWFFLACYGGGTPLESAYYHWLTRLKEAGGFGGRADGVLAGLAKGEAPPFIAALPQAALANPNGPLAVMAHVDLAWTYSFQDLGSDAQNRPSRFQGIFKALAEGKRSGLSYHQLLRFLADTSFDLTAMYDAEARAETAGQALPPDAARSRSKANLWMLRQDLAGYILLGDPATRLPIQRGAPQRVAPAPAEVRSAPVAATAAAAPLPAKAISAEPPPSPPPADFSAPAPAAAKPSGRDPVVMEEAVVAMLIGEEGARKIAARHGIPREELDRWVDTYQAAGRVALAKLP